MLRREGLVVVTWGNASGIDREAGIVAIKPSGVPYERLTPQAIVLVDLAGSVIEGDSRPSSDLATHLEIYRHFPDVGGVAHTHSVNATACAQAAHPIPCLGTTHADHFYGTVPVTRRLTQRETARDYELNTGRVIVESFSNLDPNTMPAVLVADHGPFTWGQDPLSAATNSIVLEAVASMAIRTWGLRPEHDGIEQHLLDRHFFRKHGPGAYYGQHTTPGN
jgi:L-ribulose-5-phosphate 4-epimerase